MRTLTKQCLPLVIAMAAVLHAPVTKGAIYTATASGDWSSSFTWGGVIPPSVNVTTDQIIIPIGITVNMDSDVEIDGLIASLTVDGNLTSDAGTSLTVTNGALVGGGTIMVDKCLIQGGGVVGFQGSFTADVLTCMGGALQLSANLMVNDTLELASGNLNIAFDGSLDVATDATIVISGGSLTISSGVVGLTSNYHVLYTEVSATAGAELNGLGLQDVTVEVGTGSQVTLITDLTMKGDLILLSGSLDLNGYNLIISASGDIGAAVGGTIMCGPLSNITINATAGLSGSVTLDTGSSVGNFIVDVGVGNGVQLGADLIVTGALTLQSGTLVLNNHTLTLSGDVSANGDGTIASSSSASIEIMTAGIPSGTIMLEAGAEAIGDLTINVPGASAFVAFSSDVEVHGTLSLMAGKLKLGDHHLKVVAGASITGGDQDSYIEVEVGGSVSVYVMAGAGVPVICPIGTDLKFCPVALELNPGSPSGTITVSVMAGVFAEGNTGVDISIDKPVVDVTWMIESDITAYLDLNLEVMWSADMEVNGFDNTKCFISHFTSGSWELSASAAASVKANAMFGIEMKNITSLSAFAVFDENTISSVTEVSGVSLDIYPNPTSGTLLVRVDGGSVNPVYIEVYNAVGQLVVTKQSSEQMTEVGFDALASGSYQVRVFNETFSEVKTVTKL